MLDGRGHPRRHAFRAMGTQVSLVADPPPEARAFERAARRVRLVFAREERRFSRFRGDSELARVNARAGRWTRVTPRFAEVSRLALRAASETAGLFDPTVLPVLRDLGYDRDFDEVLAGARDALRPAAPCGRWREVELEPGRIRLPEGVGLDLGGIAKGWTADLAAEEAVRQGLPWAVVNAGGDLRIGGLPPSRGLEVAIEDPQAPDAEVGRAVLAHGALATSSITRRWWGPGLHHLIDPRTGRPAETSVLQATVWAPTCARAEVAAKTAVLEGPAALERVDGLLVLADGRIVTNLPMSDAADAGREAVA